MIMKMSIAAEEIEGDACCCSVVIVIIASALERYRRVYRFST